MKIFTRLESWHRRRRIEIATRAEVISPLLGWPGFAVVFALNVVEGWHAQREAALILLEIRLRLYQLARTTALRKRKLSIH